MPHNPRPVALRYIRRSFIKIGQHTDSPAKQRSNIERICHEKGWEVEWYEDAGRNPFGSRPSFPSPYCTMTSHLSRHAMTFSARCAGWRVSSTQPTGEREAKSRVTLLLPPSELEATHCRRRIVELVKMVVRTRHCLSLRYHDWFWNYNIRIGAGNLKLPGW